MSEGPVIPRRALPAEDDEAWAPGAGRRWATPTGVASDVENDGDAVETGADATASGPTTPVPPPLPVLPQSERLAPVGRRFSADDLPDGFIGSAPRRSATSPTSYASSPITADAPSRSASDLPTTILPSVPGHPRRAGATAVAPRPRLHRWFWPVVAVAVVAGIVLAWSLIDRAGRSTVVPSAQPTNRAALLSDPADLAPLVAGASWTATTDLVPDETRGVRCVLPSSELRSAPLAGSVLRRTLTTTAGTTASVIQQVETYADEGSAIKAFSARSAQLGGCPGTPDLIAKGFAPTGLGDSALGVQVVEQDPAAVAHDLLIVRTGTTLLITDAQAGKTAPGMDALAKAVVPALQRACADAKGTCPTTPAVGEQPIPPGDPVGFLTAGDLPRVTPGAGTWVGAEMRPLLLAGSGCEAVDLTAVTKATDATQRSFLLTGDTKASPHFGLDEIVYTFATDADAKAFADSVRANITGCSKRLATATVTPLGQLSTGAGQLFTVDQRKTLSTAARSRVMVAVNGKQALYLASNPTPAFDLTDAAWLGVLERAVSRAKQLP